jgi:flagellar biosynthesis/type III secretory pathway chaperone
MELTWKQLLLVMDKITNQAYRLIDIANQLNQAIIQEKIESIGQLVIEQESEMKTFEEHEQERLALVQTIGDYLKISKDRINAAALQPYMPPAWNNDYRLQVTKLKKAMEELKQANLVNQKLLKQTRQFMSWLINYLVTPVGAAALYDDAGVSVQNSSYHVVNQNM